MEFRTESEWQKYWNSKEHQDAVKFANKLHNLTPPGWKPECNSIQCYIKKQHPSSHSWQKPSSYKFRKLSFWERCKVAWYYRFAGRFTWRWVHGV